MAGFILNRTMKGVALVGKRLSDEAIGKGISILHEEYLHYRALDDTERAFKALQAQTDLEKELEERLREQLIQSAVERKEIEYLKREGDFLAEKNRELSNSNSRLQLVLEQIEILSGLLPVCVSCRKVRTDSGYWEKLEEYLSNHSEAEFVDSLCEDCASKSLN